MNKLAYRAGYLNKMATGEELIDQVQQRNKGLAQAAPKGAPPREVPKQSLADRIRSYYRRLTTPSAASSSAAVYRPAPDAQERASFAGNISPVQREISRNPSNYDR